MREADPAREGAQLPRQHVHPARAQFGEGLARGVRRDERMPVAVAADPRAEPQPRQRAAVAEQRGVEPGITPRQGQAAVERRDCAGEALPEVVHEVAPFGGDLRFAQEDFTGAPEAFECDLDLLTAVGEFERGQARVFARVEQREQAAVLFQGGWALGLGRVRGENGFDDDLREAGGDGGGL